MEIRVYEKKDYSVKKIGDYDFAIAPSLGDQVEIPDMDSCLIYRVTRVAHHVVPLPRVSTTQTWKPSMTIEVEFLREEEV